MASTNGRRTLLAALVVLGTLVALVQGCVLGVRHQVASTTLEGQGRRVEVDADSTGFEFGVVADFRYFRLAFPAGSHSVRVEGRGQPTGYFLSRGPREYRMLALDVPLVSLVDLGGGGPFQYPGAMPHRHSLELWASGGAQPARRPHWWAGGGLVYYWHNYVAIKAYAGYGELPFREVMHAQDGAVTWEGRVGGLVGGIELTLSAGEHALDLLRFIFEEDKRVRDSTR